MNSILFIRVPAFVLMLLALNLVTACGSVPVRQVVGNQHQITQLKSGNIADRKATNAKERIEIMKQTLVSRADELTKLNIDETSLEFIAFGESEIGTPDGSTQYLLIMHQGYRGARIIDAVQYGSFDKETGELRALRADIGDISKLPPAPKTDRNEWSKIYRYVRKLFQSQGRPAAGYSVSDQPVISSKRKVAGYLAQYSVRNRNGSLSRFAAIIEPDSYKMHILYDINMD
jgi:hypothetical protein